MGVLARGGSQSRPGFRIEWGRCGGMACAVLFFSQEMELARPCRPNCSSLTSEWVAGHQARCNATDSLHDARLHPGECECVSRGAGSLESSG